MQNEEKQVTRTFAAKGLAIVGVVAVLLIGVWLAVLAVRLAPNAASTLASTFVSLSSYVIQPELITLSTSEETLYSGSTFELSWNHAEQDSEGSYTFSYFCAEGFYFTAITAEGSETVYCNTPFRFIQEENTLTLIPHTESDEPVRVQLSIQFTPNGEENPTIESTKTISVEPREGFLEVVATENPVTNGTDIAIETQTSSGVPSPATQGSTTAVPQASNSSTFPLGTTTVSTVSTTGTVDLAARVTGVGYVDPNTGVFTASSTVTTSQRAALTFVVENIGTRTSGAWSFIAILPTRPFHTFTSPQQQPLNPGDSIEFTLGFDSIEGQRFVTATVTIDPTYQTFDAERSNNVIRQQFEVITQ